MSRPTLVYVYDALCSWCYGFDAVMARIERDFADRADLALVSGGMTTGDRRRRIQDILGPDFRAIYRNVAERSGAVIGEPYLGGLVERDNYIVDSERPAIALSVFRSDPARAGRQLAFVTAMQTGMYQHGLDPNDDAYYRAAAEAFSIDPDGFLASMGEQRFIDEAHADFALTQALGITGFPHLLLRDPTGETYWSLSPGFAPYEQVAPVVEAALERERDG